MILALLFGLHAHAAALNVDEYLRQVNDRSPNVSAARLHGESGVKRAAAAGVLTAPYLFGSAAAVDDMSLQAYPAFEGTETISNAYTVGAGIDTGYGVAGKYSWNTGYTNVSGISFPTVGNYTSFNKLDLTVNLARNGLGSEVGARKELLRAGSQAQALSGDYQLVGALSQAESAYWRLAFARQAVQVQKDVLGRDEKLLEWARRRVSLQLGDRSDLLQAEASFGLHRIDLSTALEDERTASRAFNLLRDHEGDSVPEDLMVPSTADTLSLSAPTRTGERLDVQAAAERTKAAQAQSQLDKEQIKPSVDLVGSYAWNGRDPLRGSAISDAFGNLHPTKQIAVNFTVPLDVPTWTRAIQGGNQEIEAADYDLRQTRLAEVRDWSDLVEHLARSRARLELLGSLETVQKDKFDHERERLLQGRTTTFQTITFEQDYASTQLQRLRMQAEVLQTVAQMKAFRGKL